MPKAKNKIIICGPKRRTYLVDGILKIWFSPALIAANPPAVQRCGAAYATVSLRAPRFVSCRYEQSPARRRRLARILDAVLTVFITGAPICTACT
jgi:hypothetical protein